MEVKNVVVVNDFNYVQGGASKVAIDTAKMLYESGLKVYFFSAVNREEENIEGIEYVTTNQKEALKEENKIKGAVNGIYNFKVRKKFKELLIKLDNKNTIIHVHGWTKALSSSVFDVAFKMKFKVVLTLHDYFTACPNGGYFNYRTNEICNIGPMSFKCVKCNCDSRNYAIKLYRVLREFTQNKIVKLNEKLENVITISEFSENILKNTLGTKASISRIYNPIKISEIKEKNDYKKNEYYLYVGRIDREKGVDLFCKAIDITKKKGIVVGDGNEREKLEKEYNNIEFTGWKDKEEVEEYMKKCKALVFPSRWYETSGLTILEAQILGIPVIVSNKCAGREFVEEGVNGYIFEDFEDLKNKITLIDTQPSMNIKMNDILEQNYVEEIMKLYGKM